MKTEEENKNLNTCDIIFEQASQTDEWHICKYCNSLVNSSDDDCYMNPKKNK